MRTIRRIILVALAAALASAVAPSIASAVTREEAVARGMRWVDYRSAEPTASYDSEGRRIVGVEYSQKRYADESGARVDSSSKGYRTDCSGFVSLCWGLRTSGGAPMSYSTYGFATATSKFVQITKDQLMPGDMVLKSTVWGAQQGDAHAILFAGWVDATRTSYWAMEQTSGTDFNGTVRRVRPWGQKYYRPYRYIYIDDDFHDCQTRVMGNDRYSTAAAAVKISYPTSPTVTVPALVVASGQNWPDALGGAALAGAVGGPLLLTAKDSLPAATRAQIVRLKPATVYVLGGPASVSGATAKQVAGTGAKVVRLGGNNRYEVAALVARTTVAEARKAGKTVDTAYIATGRTFPDALAVSPIAARTARPVLLTETSRLSWPTALAIKELGIKKVVVLGGTTSVAPAVETALRAMGVTVERIARSNRYNTAVAIAHHGAGLGVGLGWENLGIASGEVFPDALSGGCSQGQTGALMLLTPGKSLNTDVKAELAEHDPDKVRVFGGFITIQQRTRQAVADVLRATQ